MAQRDDHRPLRIAVIGTRGVPATYGGIERHVEEISARLVERGHEVTVFCRTNYIEGRPATHRGIRLRHLPTVDSKSLDAIVHSFVSSVATLGRGFDIVHYHGVGPGLTAPLPRYLGRTPVVLTVHGLDGDRAKWTGVAKTALQAGTWMSAHVPAATIVVSHALADHYRDTYGRTADPIPNGVNVVAPPPPGPALARLGLDPLSYALFVGRFVPEKAPHRLVRAFRATAPPEARLVLVGGSSFTDDYAAEVVAAADGDPRVLLPGYVYGDELNELYAHAGVFVQPSDVEGLPLTMLEAASFGTPVLASDIPPHVEVLRADGPGRRLTRAGDVEDLGRVLGAVLRDLPAERAGAGALREEVVRRYSWDTAADDTVAVYQRVVRAGRRSRAARESVG